MSTLTMQNMSSDAELAAAGRALAERHFQSLWRYFKNKAGQDADDLVQDTLLACARYPERLATAEDVQVYVLAMARNRLRAYLRARHPNAPLEQTCLRDLGTTPSEAVARDERQRRLHDALQRLPLAQQELLELFYWNELDGAAIAALLGVPEGTVRTRIRAARAALRKLLPEASIGPGPGFRSGPSAR